MLFLAYPRSDYDEPEGALTSYVEVLQGYSEGIAQFVTSNKTGVQRRSKFPPRVAELVAACDEAAATLERSRRYSNWGRNQPLAIAGPPPAPKPSLEQLQAKYGKDWGIGKEDEKATFGCAIPQEILDAIPDAPIGAQAFERPEYVKDWKPQAPNWSTIATAYAADPARIRALTETEFMSRKSTLA